MCIVEKEAFYIVLPVISKEVFHMAEEKFNKVAYNNKYNADKYDSLRIVVPKGKKAIIKAHAESIGESINGFVNKAIDKAMEE